MPSLSMNVSRCEQRQLQAYSGHQYQNPADPSGSPALPCRQPDCANRQGRYVCQTARSGISGLTSGAGWQRQVPTLNLAAPVSLIASNKGEKRESERPSDGSGRGVM